MKTWSKFSTRKKLRTGISVMEGEDLGTGTAIYGARIYLIYMRYINKPGLRSKWDITEPTKIEGKPAVFGSSCHVVLPKAWANKVVVTVTKETWEALQR